MTILFAKQLRYRYRCMKKEIYVHIFKDEVYKFRSYELYYAKTNNALSKHAKKWSPLFPDLNFSEKINITDNFIAEYVNNI